MEPDRMVCKGSSIHMDRARNKNHNMQRQLNVNMQLLAKDREIFKSKMVIQERLVNNILIDLQFDGGGRGRSTTTMVAARGLSAAQKTALKELSRPKPKSLTLEQFDQRLSYWKRMRDLQRQRISQDLAEMRRKQKGANFTNMKVTDEEAEEAKTKLNPKIEESNFVRTCCETKSAEKFLRSKTALF